jgi:hypothetical protein
MVPEVAVISALPADTPVATSPLTVAIPVLSLLNKTEVKVNGLPNWSTPAALNVCVPPTRIEALVGVIVMEVSTGAAGTTVSVAGAEVILLAVAVMVTLPPLCVDSPVTTPVFTPSLLMPFTTARVVLELVHVNVSPVITSPN